VFAVSNAETLGALQYDTAYPGASGTFRGFGTDVACGGIIGDFASFNDLDDQDTLSTAITSTVGFTGPIDIAQCSYTSLLPRPAADDFTVEVIEQSRPDSAPASAIVEVREVACNCPSDRTTTTTTTLPEVGAPYLVSFDLVDAVTLGPIQVEVDYGNAGGSFVGDGADVECTSPLTAGGAFVAFADFSATAQLNFAAITATSYTGPTRLADCVFLAPDAAPSADGFIVTVVDAATPDLQPVVPLPTVSVSSITPRSR
jgi:hypothetical protein